MKELVIFDIDDTIIRGQSQRLFLSYVRSIGYVSRTFYARLMLWFIAYKLGLVREPAVAMRYAFSFLKGRSVAEVSALTHDFFTKKLQSLIYPDMREAIAAHRTAGREVIFVSNAVDFLVKEVASYVGVTHYISSQLEVRDGVYTGAVKHGMYGGQKTQAVADFARERGYGLATAWAYSDHISDADMLSLVGHPVAVNPSEAFAGFARRRGWDIMRCKLPLP